MIWDPTHKPRLRPVEAFALPDGNGTRIGLRDRTGLSECVLALSPAALQVVSLMDGSHTCDGILDKSIAAVGQSLPIDVLQALMTQLEDARFLEGAQFEAYYESRLRDFRQTGVRTVQHPEAVGVAGGSQDVFIDMLAEAPAHPGTGLVRGLVAPHLDYPRGRPCYAAAYATLRNRPVPHRVVILGTNHFGLSSSVVATASDFATPLGRVKTDVDFIERLEHVCGDLRAYELDHVQEHSIELQILWLQHLFGADSFTTAAFLCPDPCGPTGTAPYDGQGVDLRAFALALREQVDQDAVDTLVVAGADLSHVGAAFGDERRLDQTYLEEVKRRDLSALSELTRDDPDAFVRCVAEGKNPTSVCSAGCLFTLATVLRPCEVTLLDYHQAVDRPSQTCVTCAALAYT